MIKLEEFKTSDEAAVAFETVFDPHDGAGCDRAHPADDSVSLDPFTLDDLAGVEAYGGTPPDSEWICVCLLRDGRWVKVWYGHDYTSTWGGATVANDRDTLVLYGLTTFERKALGVRVGSVENPQERN